jgi:hypothetical protein
MYDIRDVLRKGIAITEKKKNEYVKLQENSGDIRLRLLIGVFIRAFEKDIVYYNRLVDNITDSIAEGIDFWVFDKISSLVNQFSRIIMPINITDRKELVAYALEQEKATYALLVDIQGRMVSNDSPASIAYYVLLEIIDVKRSFIEELEKMS